MIQAHNVKRDRLRRHWLAILWLSSGVMAAEQTGGDKLRGAFREPSPEGLQPVSRWRQDNGTERLVNPLQPGVDHRSSREVAFLAVVTNRWPAGLVPLFEVEREGQFELRRRPLRGQENVTEPLCFALPLEDEPDAARISGWWECHAVRGDGSKEALSWELTVETNRVAGRFDPETQYRFGYITAGNFRSNRLELRVEYAMDAYLLTGEWRDHRMRGEFHHVDESERGTWEARRNAVRIPTGFEAVLLYEWRHESSAERRYAIEGETPGSGSGWKRNDRPLCRVWRANRQPGQAPGSSD